MEKSMRYFTLTIQSITYVQNYKIKLINEIYYITFNVQYSYNTLFPLAFRRVYAVKFCVVRIFLMYFLLNLFIVFTHSISYVHVFMICL